MSRYFEFARHGTTWRTEIMAGLATFLTMAYIIVVNPAIVVQQIESGIVYGLGPALKHGIYLDKGRVTNTNFNSYDPTRIDETPEIEVHILPSTAAPGGTGEASTPTTPPAVLNAVYAATKKRIRVLPALQKDLA